jgi:hypothetical protein
MPVKEFTITIKGGSLDGLEFKKYSQIECDNLVEFMESYHSLKCNVEVKSLI